MRKIVCMLALILVLLSANFVYASSAFITKFGSEGSADGQFNRPIGVATDSMDNIIVVDTFNHRIQVFDSTGKFLFNFGSIGSGNGLFNRPIDVGSSGNIIVSDGLNHRIQVFDSTGKFLFRIGSEGSNNGEFKRPVWL